MLSVIVITICFLLLSSSSSAFFPKTLRNRIRTQSIGVRVLNTLPMFPKVLPLFSIGGDGSNFDGGHNNNDPPKIPPDEMEPFGENAKRPQAASGLLLLLGELFAKYNTALEKNPLLTKMFTAGAISAMGDILIQWITGSTRKDFSFDFRRLIIFTSVGMFFIAPLVGWWFGVLDMIPSIIFGNKLNDAMKAVTMVVIDQTIASAIVLCGFYYAYELFDTIIPPFDSTRPLSEWPSRSLATVKANARDTLVANWTFWPVVNYVCFAVIPLSYRLMFSNIMATFWNMYLSNKAAKVLAESKMT